MAQVVGSDAAVPTSRQPRSPNYIFIRHFLEMFGAMIAGMAILGGLVSLICMLLGHSEVLDHVEVLALLMPAYMTTGMAVLMRYRSHNWLRVAEMGAAMYAPFILLLAFFAAGVISGGAVLGPGHVLMFAGMLGVMLWRRQEYAVDHGNHGRLEGSEHSRHSAHSEP